MRKIKKDLSDSESKKVVNALLIYIVVESASFNLSKNDLYKKEIKMHVNALVKEIEKYGDIFHQLCDISIERFQSISEAAETISLMFLNGFNDEHIDIIDKVMKVITQKKYALQLAQIKSILGGFFQPKPDEEPGKTAPRISTLYCIFASHRAVT